MNEITTAAELDALPDDARMDAYYYSFDRTGVGPVDAILSAVAVAGKGSHHTDGWNDPSGYGYYKGRPGLPDADSATELIQNTANRAADQIRAAMARPDAHARTEPTEEQVAVQCVWTGEAGYRCPRCGLYVCVPQQAHGAECPRCVVSSFEVLGDQIHDAHEEWDGMVERDPAELTSAILALLRGEA